MSVAIPMTCEWISMYMHRSVFIYLKRYTCKQKHEHTHTHTHIFIYVCI